MRHLLALFALLSAASTVQAQPSQDSLPASWWALANSVKSEDLDLVKQLRSLKWDVACIKWGKGQRAQLSSRRHRAMTLMLQSDKLLNEINFVQVNTRTVEIGMNTCGVLASLGRPETVNTTRTATATRAQLIYTSRKLYVYTEAAGKSGNGIVRTIQQ